MSNNPDIDAAIDNKRLAMMNFEKAMELEAPTGEVDFNPIMPKEKEATVIDGRA